MKFDIFECHNDVHLKAVAYVHHFDAIRYDKLHSACAGILFSQLSAAVVRHKANNSAVYEIRARFNYDTALSSVV